MTFDEATLAETNTPEALDVVCRKAMRYGLVKASAYLRGYERKSPGSICFLVRSVCFAAISLVRAQTASLVDIRGVRVSLEAVWIRPEQDYARAFRYRIEMGQAWSPTPNILHLLQHCLPMMLRYDQNKVGSELLSCSRMATKVVFRLTLRERKAID